MKRTTARRSRAAEQPREPLMVVGFQSEPGPERTPGWIAPLLADSDGRGVAIDERGAHLTTTERMVIPATCTPMHPVPYVQGHAVIVLGEAELATLRRGGDVLPHPLDAMRGDEHAPEGATWARDALGHRYLAWLAHPTDKARIFEILRRDILARLRVALDARAESTAALAWQLQRSAATDADRWAAAIALERAGHAEEADALVNGYRLDERDRESGKSLLPGFGARTALHPMRLARATAKAAERLRKVA